MSRGNAGMITALSIAFLLSLVIVICTADQGSGQIFPEVYAQLDQTERSADVTPGGTSNGIVIFSGIIHCDCNLQSQVTVSLQVSVGGWGAAITPSSMTFRQGGPNEQCMSVTIRAPPGTSSSVSREMEVHGSWTGAQGLTGDVDPAYGMIFIEQYFIVEIDARNSLEMETGQWKTVNIKINNTGNGDDEIRIEVVDLEELKDRGWKIDPISSQSIPVNGTKSFSLRIKAPSKEGNHLFKLRAESIGSEESDPNDVRYEIHDLTVKVRKADSIIPGIPFIGPIETIAVMVASSMVYSKRRRVK